MRHVTLWHAAGTFNPARRCARRVVWVICARVHAAKCVGLVSRRLQWCGARINTSGKRLRKRTGVYTTDGRMWRHRGEPWRSVSINMGDTYFGEVISEQASNVLSIPRWRQMRRKGAKGVDGMEELYDSYFILGGESSFL